MALPNTITNGPGKFPDATKLQENFDYLYALIIGGRVIKQDTLANLKTYAALNPTIPFVCINSDNDSFMCYMGKTTVCDGGFQSAGGTGAGPVSDIDDIERG